MIKRHLRWTAEKSTWNRRELAEKALLKPFTIFSRLLSQLVGWFDEVSCSGSTLCWDKSPHERVFPIDWDKSMCASNEAQFEIASWSDCYSMPQLETTNDPKFYRCMISRARRCIRAGGHAFTDKYKRLIVFEPQARTYTDNKV
jgi:hypothetical protein